MQEHPYHQPHGEDHAEADDKEAVLVGGVNSLHRRDAKPTKTAETSIGTTDEGSNFFSEIFCGESLRFIFCIELFEIFNFNFLHDIVKSY